MKRKERRQAHFIQAIRGGSVVKVPSRDSHGVPALRLKGLAAIYEIEDAEKLYSGTRYKGDRVVGSESEIYESNREGHIRTRNLDADDDTLGSMTLKEIKERSKRKKRKLSKSFDSEKKEFGNCSVGGIPSSKNDGIVQMKKEAAHDDLLSCLELKLYKKPRSKRRKTSKDTCTSSKSPIAIDAPNQQFLTYRTFSESAAGINEPFSTKINILDLDYLDSQDVVNTADDTTCGSRMKISCDGECFNEKPEGVNGSAFEMGKSFSLCKEISSSVTDEVPDEYFPEEPSILACTATNLEATKKLTSPEAPKSLASVESQPMVDVSNEYLEPENRLTSNTLNSESAVGINESFSTNIEILELEHLDSQNVVHSTDGTTCGSCIKISCVEECFDERQEGVNRSVSEMGESFSLCKEISSSVADEVPDEYLPEEPSLLACTATNFEATTKLSSLEVPKSLLSVESHCVEDVSDEYLNPEEQSFSASNTLNPEEIIEVSFPEINMSLPSFVSGYLEEAVATHSILYSSPSKATEVAINQGSEIDPSMEQSNLSCHTDNTLTQMTEMACCSSSQCEFPHYGCDRSVPVIDDDDAHKKNDSSKSKYVGNQTLASIHGKLTTDTLDSMELNNGGCGFGINVGHEGGFQKSSTPDFGPASTNTSDSISFTSEDRYPFFSSDNSPVFMDDGSLTSMQKYSSIPTTRCSLTCADVALEGYSGDYCSDSTEGHINVEAHKGCFSMMTENHPKNLFSTRKAISPTSQEKLCHVLNFGESCDNMENFKCREKSFINEQTESRNSPVSSGIEGRDSFIIPKQNMKRLKSNKSGSLHGVPRSVIKDQPFSFSRPSCGMQFESVDTSAQKAIEFSERQMQDIENLALKLMKELRSMKNIVEETLCSEVSQGAPPKCTPSQISSAVENVARVEGTTKRWLSMMARDCIRFCKIMEFSGMKSSPSSEVEAHKKKKNVTFADEDGGVLCHVRVYEDCQHLPEVSYSLQPDNKSRN